MKEMNQITMNNVLLGMFFIYNRYKKYMIDKNVKAIIGLMWIKIQTALV